MARVICAVLLAVAAGAAAFAADRFPATGGDILITPMIHSSVQIEHAGRVVQVDPWTRGDLSRAKMADLILVTDADSGGHHLDAKAIARLRKPGAPVVIPATGKEKVPDGIVLANGGRRTVAGVTVEAIAAYDIKPGDPYHPKGEANGYVITLGGRRIYFAGVTECIPEIRALTNIDVAFMPMNTPLDRMTPAGLAECVKAFKPGVVYPYHFDQERLRAAAAPAPSGGTPPRGFAELIANLQGSGIEVRSGDWYPAVAAAR